MVGLTDHNIQLHARIRVGQDFGRIRYLGDVCVTHRLYKFPETYIFCLFSG